jgi:cell division transport system permease protein
MLNKIFKTNDHNDHLLNITLSLKKMLNTPIISAIIILTTTLALFLAATSYMLWNSRDALHDHWNKSAEISLHLKKNIDATTATALQQKLQQNPVVVTAELIPASDGLKAFAENIELSKLLSSFKDNPLPNVIVIHPKIKVLAKSLILEFIQELKKQPEIETVSVDTDWIERSYSWLNMGDSLLLLLIFALSINAFLIIGGISYITAHLLALKNNTAHFFTLKNNTAEEIIPYQFAWYSLISGLLSLILVRLITTMLHNQDILIQGLNVGPSIFLMLVSPLLSFVSAKIAIDKSG